MKSCYQIRNERRIIHRTVIASASVVFVIYCGNNGNTTSSAFAGSLFTLCIVSLVDAVKREILRRRYGPHD